MFPINFQVIYETKGSGDEMMMSSSEVVVANEEEVEHETKKKSRVFKFAIKTLFVF